jgi:hypothetical protein
MALDGLEYLLRRLWRDLSLPADVQEVATMLSLEERKLLYALAREYAGEDAAIVDGGCFLGGSTVALLAGVRDRPQPWRGPPVELRQVGGSFRPALGRERSRFGIPHVVHEGDIVHIAWSGGPIDVLFLGVVKSWKINDAVLRDFFPFSFPVEA